MCKASGVLKEHKLHSLDSYSGGQEQEGDWIRKENVKLGSSAIFSREIGMLGRQNRR